MKIYVVTLGAGVLAGIVYGLLGVRSPAPPLVALVGLLGMLVGEQVFAVAQRVLRGEAVTVGWFLSECAPKVTGTPPAPPAASPGAAPAARGEPSAASPQKGDVP